ncbi:MULTISPECIES: hypothetical protein [unclassified Microcoleus]|uniref:hypothetical protein n=1 Tax=unclassified Microcoleus TaxID=2642155 RepID=UPI002FD21989
MKVEILSSFEDNFFGERCCGRSHSLREAPLDAKSLALIGNWGMGIWELEVKIFCLIPTDTHSCFFSFPSPSTKVKVRDRHQKKNW